MVKLTLFPENERHRHLDSGINCGEVGFPTRLSINGFTFFGLQHPEHEGEPLIKNIYFKYLNMNTVGIKFH